MSLKSLKATDHIAFNTRKCKAQAFQSLLSAMSVVLPHPPPPHTLRLTHWNPNPQGDGIRKWRFGERIDDKHRIFQNEVGVLTKEPGETPWGEDSPKMVLWEMGPYQLPNLLLPWSHTSQPPKSGGINFLLLLNCLVYGIFSDQRSKACIQPLHCPALPRATEMLKGCSLWQAVLWAQGPPTFLRGKLVCLWTHLPHRSLKKS